MFWKRKNDREADVERELLLALELEAEERQADGMSAEQAHFAARRSFGNLSLIKEQTREVWLWVFLDRFLQDLRFAIRTLQKNPGFALAAACTLALGIGANAAMFSVVDTVLLKPLPFPEPKRLVRIWGDIVRQQASLMVLRERSRTADYAAYSDNTELNFTGDGTPQRLVASLVTANLFSVLGGKPMLGRGFLAGEDGPGGDRVIILSYWFWKNHFRSDRSILDRVITIDDVRRRVVGVMPPDFRFPSVETASWIPTVIDSRDIGTYWWSYNLNIVGRLRPGKTMEAAQSELASLIFVIRDSFPWKMWPDWGQKARLVDLQETLVGSVRTRLLVLFAAVGLVLLISCANVANLLLARGASRQKEIAVRAALGAHRGRIVRQLLTESLLLAGVGGTAGFVIAFVTNRLFWHILPLEFGQFSGGQLNLRALSFTAVLTLGTALLFGILPALRSSKANVQGGLRSERPGTSNGRHRQQLATALMTFEIAIAVTVLIGGGLLANSFWRLVEVDPGFQRHHELTALVTPNPTLCRVPGRCLAFYQEVLERTRSFPGVESVGAVNPLPLGGDINGGAMEIEGHPVLPGHSAPTLWASVVTPGYLTTLGIPIHNGRGILASDTGRSEAVILVTRSTASRWWHGENAIGKHIRYITEKKWRTVVGVVGDTYESSLAGEPNWMEGHVYFPLSQSEIDRSSRMSIVLRTAADPLQLIEPLRQTIARIRSDVPVSAVRTMDEVVSDSVSTPRSTMWLLLSFAGLALVLSLIGVYAVVSYSVAETTHEVGIRMALGAQARDVLQEILTRSLLVALTGLTLGLGVAYASTRVMETLLFQITSHDPLAFSASPIALLMLIMLATYLPARRATRVDPLTALRHE